MIPQLRSLVLSEAGHHHVLMQQQATQYTLLHSVPQRILGLPTPVTILEPTDIPCSTRGLPVFGLAAPLFLENAQEIFIPVEEHPGEGAKQQTVEN
jgi:hypothetical protein